MKMPLFDRVLRLLSGAIIVASLIIFFTSIAGVHRSGERLINTIEDKKRLSNDDIAKKVGEIDKKLDDMMLKIQQMRDELSEKS
ncbi:TPA: hypothetical protein QIF01_003382 [Serratia marcescens]|nr:hypothetical protein [Serratia marcescens]